VSFLPAYYEIFGWTYSLAYVIYFVMTSRGILG